jgi:tripartite-type tricarboxylate transporter receptor subunit TctC
MTRLLPALLLLPLLAWAQAYPSRPVKLVVTFPPGGTPDIYGRIMAAELQKAWLQPVIVENRAGAGGAIGTDAVAKAAPDGYTLLFAADATITLAPAVIARLPYDPVRDLSPIVNVTAGRSCCWRIPRSHRARCRSSSRLRRRSRGRFPMRRRARVRSSTCRWKRCVR